jgi:hypothetical protein
MIIALLCACGGDDSDVCPSSLATDSAEWSAPPDASSECSELATALAANGGTAFGDGGDCPGRMREQVVAGLCRVTLSSTCEGVTFELDCDVHSDRSADCSVRVEAPELENACTLRLSLR